MQRRHKGCRGGKRGANREGTQTCPLRVRDALGAPDGTHPSGGTFTTDYGVRHVRNARPRAWQPPFRPARVSSETFQYPSDECGDIRLNTRAFAFALPRDIDNPRPVVLHPQRREPEIRIDIQVDLKPGPVMLLAESRRSFRTTRQTSPREDEGGVAFLRI